MTDYRALVKDLREAADDWEEVPDYQDSASPSDYRDAADAIEALLAENERLRDRVAELESAWKIRQSTGANAP